MSQITETLSSRWQRVCDFITGDSPMRRALREQQEKQRRAYEEKLDALIGELRQFNTRFKEKKERHDSVAGVTHGLIYDFKHYAGRLEAKDKDALKKAAGEQLKAIDAAKEEWRALLAEVLDFSKRRVSVSSPDLVTSFVGLADGISRQVMAMSDLRKGFVNNGRAAGIIAADDDIAIQTPVKVMQPLKLKPQTA